MYPRFKLNPFGVIGHGNIQGVNRTTPEQITGLSGASDIDYVIIKADPDNSENIHIGSSTVTTNDFQLDAGDTIEFSIKDLRNVYVLASDASQNVQFIYFKQ